MCYLMLVFQGEMSISSTQYSRRLVQHFCLTHHRSLYAHVSGKCLHICLLLVLSSVLFSNISTLCAWLFQVPTYLPKKSVFQESFISTPYFKLRTLLGHEKSYLLKLLMLPSLFVFPTAQLKQQSMLYKNSFKANEKSTNSIFQKRETPLDTKHA